MKMFTLVSIIAISAIATAQTESPAPATTANTTVQETTKPVQAEAKKSAKNMKKMKKAKKAVKPSAKINTDQMNTELKGSTTVSTTDTASTMNATSTTSAASSAAAVVAPVAGTSTTTTTAAVAPKKMFNVTLLNDSSSDINTVKNINDAKIDMDNQIRASIMVTDKTSVGVRQHIEYSRVAGQANQGYIGNTALTLGTKVNGIFGSKEISPLFLAYLPTRAAAESTERLYKITNFKGNGTLRMDAEIAWDITPLWTVSYYMSPREYFMESSDYLDNAGKILYHAGNTAALTHSANLYMNINDNIQPYTYVGMKHKVLSNYMTSYEDKFIAGIGGSFQIGILNLAPEINTELALKKNKEYVSAPKWFQSEDIGYELVTSVAF